MKKLTKVILISALFVLTGCTQDDASLAENIEVTNRAIDEMILEMGEDTTDRGALLTLNEKYGEKQSYLEKQKVPTEDLKDLYSDRADLLERIIEADKLLLAGYTEELASSTNPDDQRTLQIDIDHITQEIKAFEQERNTFLEQTDESYTVPEVGGDSVPFDTSQMTPECQDIVAKLEIYGAESFTNECAYIYYSNTAHQYLQLGCGIGFEDYVQPKYKPTDGSKTLNCPPQPL